MFDDFIKQLGSNEVLCFKLDEDIVKYCIETYYFEDLGDVFIIRTIAGPTREKKVFCENIGNSLGVKVKLLEAIK